MEVRTGIVVEGGGMRGVYAAGVLDILLERGIETDDLVGVSAGAVYGCSFVAGQAGCSIRYNLRYCRDSRYTSFRSLITTDDPVGDEFCCHELPERLDPFDNDAFKASPMEFYATCTDVEIGRPVYHRCDNLRGENVQQIRTSASTPLVSRIVEIDGHELLDGGMFDPVPAVAFRKMDFGRSLVIFIRPDGYRKKPSRMLPAIRRVYHRYSESTKTIECRHLVYNRELGEVRRTEIVGETLVIRPSHLIKISRTENRPGKI